jgi:hypothetical protein
MLFTSFLFKKTFIRTFFITSVAVFSFSSLAIAGKPMLMKIADAPEKIVPDPEKATVVVIQQRLPMVGRIGNYWVFDEKVIGQTLRDDDSWFIGKVDPGTKFMHNIPSTIKKPLFSYKMNLEKGKIYYVFCNLITGGPWVIAPWTPDEFTKHLKENEKTVYLAMTGDPISVYDIAKQGSIAKAEKDPLTEGRGLTRATSNAAAKTYGFETLKEVWENTKGYDAECIVPKR